MTLPRKDVPGCHATIKKLVAESWAADAPMVPTRCSRGGRHCVGNRWYCLQHAQIARGEPPHASSKAYNRLAQKAAEEMRR